MPIADPEKIWPKLEKLGSEEVRKKLAMGVYARYKIPVIEEWLREREDEQNAPTFMYHKINAPKGKVFPASEVPVLEREGWVDTPAKFKKDDTVCAQKIVKALRHLLVRTWKDPVWSKIIAVGILTFLGVMWASLNGDEPKNPKTIQTINVKQNQVKPKNIHPVSNGKLPYLENLPILDKTIYLKYSYNDLLIGGKNIGKVKIGVRTHDGRDAKPFFESHPNAVSFNIHDRPYVEFEYAGKYYSIEIIGEMHSYQYVLKELPDSSLITMDLDTVQIK